ARLEKIAERQRIRVRLSQNRRRLAVEAEDLFQQTEMRRTQQVARLCEKSVRAAAAVLQPRSLARHAETHVRRSRLEPDLGKEPDEIRVRAIVVNEKACVQREGAGGWGLHHDRVRVAAQTSIFLEQPHLMLPAEEGRGDRRSPG